ncbi:MAG: hypothetical protein NG740_04930, partial [Omnitrophica bacterium]|nr:hypothetical protein [Candidatus Omnitrophota bacterium]
EFQFAVHKGLKARIEAHNAEVQRSGQGVSLPLGQFVHPGRGGGEHLLLQGHIDAFEFANLSQEHREIAARHELAHLTMANDPTGELAQQMAAFLALPENFGKNEEDFVESLPGCETHESGLRARFAFLEGLRTENKVVQATALYNTVFSLDPTGKNNDLSSGAIDEALALGVQEITTNPNNFGTWLAEDTTGEAKAILVEALQNLGVLAAIHASQKDYWAKRILMEVTRIKVSREAEKSRLREIWESSGHTRGYISVEHDPTIEGRIKADGGSQQDCIDAILAEVKELGKIAANEQSETNVLVKIRASRNKFKADVVDRNEVQRIVRAYVRGGANIEDVINLFEDQIGLRVLLGATEAGVNTNYTLVVSPEQALAAQAVAMEGKRRAAANGITKHIEARISPFVSRTDAFTTAAPEKGGHPEVIKNHIDRAHGLGGMINLKDMYDSTIDIFGVEMPQTFIVASVGSKVDGIPQHAYIAFSVGGSYVITSPMQQIEAFNNDDGLVEKNISRPMRETLAPYVRLKPGENAEQVDRAELVDGAISEWQKLPEDVRREMYEILDEEGDGKFIPPYQTALDTLFDQAVRVLKLQELRNQTVQEELANNHVYYAWGGRGNAVMSGEEGNLAEIWHYFTIETGDRKLPCEINVAEMAPGEEAVELEAVTMSELLEANPDMIGDREDLSYFTKTLSPAAKPRVFIGFNKRIEEPGEMDEFIAAVQEERLLMVDLMEMLNEMGVSEDDFRNVFLPHYNTWVEMQYAADWKILAVPVPYIGDIGDESTMRSGDFVSLLGKIRSNRRTIVSYLHSTELGDEQTVLAPAGDARGGYLHRIVGSFQLHPAVIPGTSRDHPEAKHEAWITYSVGIDPATGREEFVTFEIMNMADVTFSPFDFDVPFGYADGKVTLRKDLRKKIGGRLTEDEADPATEEEAIEIMLRSLNPKGYEDMSEFDITSRREDRTSEYLNPERAKAVSCIEGTYEVQPRELWVVHELQLNGEGADAKAKLEIPSRSRENDFEQLLVVNGSIDIRMPGESKVIHVSQGRAVFIPATKGDITYTIESDGRARVVRSYPGKDIGKSVERAGGLAADAGDAGTMPATEVPTEVTMTAHVRGDVSGAGNKLELNLTSAGTTYHEAKLTDTDNALPLTGLNRPVTFTVAMGSGVELLDSTQDGTVAILSRGNGETHMVTDTMFLRSDDVAVVTMQHGQTREEAPIETTVEAYRAATEAGVLNEQETQIFMTRKTHDTLYRRRGGLSRRRPGNRRSEAHIIDSFQDGIAGTKLKITIVSDLNQVTQSDVEDGFKPVVWMTQSEHNKLSDSQRGVFAGFACLPPIADRFMKELEAAQSEQEQQGCLYIGELLAISVMISAVPREAIGAGEVPDYVKKLMNAINTMTSNPITRAGELGTYLPLTETGPALSTAIEGRHVNLMNRMLDAVPVEPFNPHSDLAAKHAVLWSV